MSNHGADRPGAGGAELDRLEEAVDRALVKLRAARDAAKEAEQRAERSDRLMRQLVDGRQDPAALADRVAQLEAENEDLRDRIGRGREAVDGILASIRFLEERR
ncbi:MAG: hypothetical protein OXF01_08075 [Gemmatimonadetes bacterium]|nr:hypothetical protein [Gemmatimonadota bacterium]